MRISLRHLFTVLGAGVMFWAGTASADLMTDRYFLALDCIEKATALLNAIEPANAKEASQRDQALDALADAEDDINCALARRVDPKADCK